MLSIIRYVAAVVILLVTSGVALATPESEIFDAVQTSRQKVTALIAVDNEGVQSTLINEIAVITQDVNARTDTILADEATSEEVKARLTVFKMIWDQLVLTRDNEMIPAIVAGDKDKAQKIGQEIQAERFRKITGLLK